jgi:hypothetical protein
MDNLHVKIFKREAVKNNAALLSLHRCHRHRQSGGGTKNFSMTSCFPDTLERLQVFVTCHNFLLLTTIACRSLKSLILEDSQIQK